MWTLCALLAEAEALSVRVRLAAGGFKPSGGLQRRLSWYASGEVARFAVGLAQCEVSLVIYVTCHGFSRSLRTQYRPYDEYIPEATASRPVETPNVQRTANRRSANGREIENVERPLLSLSDNAKSSGWITSRSMSRTFSVVHSISCVCYRRCARLKTGQGQTSR
jgi:hypothetical protein